MPNYVPLSSSSCFDSTRLLQNVLDIHPVMEIWLLPYALQPVYMSLYPQQEVKQGQKGTPLFVSM